MTCGYCGAINPEEEHRCLRCGRRLGGFAPAHPQTSALPVQETPPVVTLPTRDPGAPRVPHQQNLFRVIPIESIARLRPEEGSRRRRPQPRETARRLPHADQPNLNFPTPAAEPPAALAAKPVVQCEVPVASLRSRSEAVAVDSLMVLIAGAIVLGGFAGWTRHLPLGRTAALIYGSALTLILFFYRVLSCLLADRSPGLRMAGLHLLHFDGRPATRQQRLLRLAASCLSLAPLGIGFLWALVDEEHLTFHDHISETFPTPDHPAR